jgi:ketol-acid reductoisomerase
MRENKKGRPHFEQYRKDAQKHPIEKVGSQLREMMSWMKK